MFKIHFGGQGMPKIYTLVDVGTSDHVKHAKVPHLCVRGNLYNCKCKTKMNSLFVMSNSFLKQKLILVYQVIQDDKYDI